MHIGLVTACYEPVLNGVTRMVTLYKAHFEAAGHKVSVFTLGGRQDVGDEVNVYRSPALPLGSTGYHFALGYSKSAQKALSGVDIIHCHHLIMGLEFARRYGKCPIVLTNHTRYDLYMGAYTRLPQAAADQLFSFVWPMMTSYCDVVIVPSESVRKVMDEFGVACPKVVINNGIDLDRFRKDDSGLIRQKLQIPGGAVPLVYVGRLSPEKNLNTLLEAFAIAVASAPELVLILIGSGSLEDKLRRQASGLGISDKLRFCGSVPNAEVPDYLAASEIFVTASITEVHPLTIIEAMATGLPIAAVMSPGIVDLVIQGATGLLAENSAGSLAEALVTLARDKGRRRLMGAFARQMSRQYDINKTVAKTLNLYQKLIRSKAGIDRRRINRHWADLP